MCRGRRCSRIATRWSLAAWPACCSGARRREPSGGAWGCANGVLARLADGQFRRAKDAQAWIKKHPQNTQREWRPQGATPIGQETEGTPQKPRKKDPAKAAAFKMDLPRKLELLAGPAARTGQPVRLWVLDEHHRYGLLPVIRRVWGQRGIRVQHAPYATRYQWGYLHEAVEVDGANQMELLFTPCIDQDVHTLFLKQLGDTDPAACCMWSSRKPSRLPSARENDPRLPHNVRLLPLPPYSPELNPVEKLHGDIVKDRICNRLYPSLRRLEDHPAHAALRPWRTPSTAPASCGVDWQRLAARWSKRWRANLKSNY